jgi:hypothetical protein
MGSNEQEFNWTEVNWIELLTVGFDSAINVDEVI